MGLGPSSHQLPTSRGLLGLAAPVGRVSEARPKLLCTLSVNEPCKQLLTEGYRVPAVLPWEDNLAEIAHYLLKESLVSGAGADTQEMI